MGEKNSKPVELENFIKSHTKLKTYKDERYGKITIFKKTSNPEEIFFMKERWTTDRNSEIKILNELKELKIMGEHEHLAAFKGHFKEVENTMCNNYVKHYTLFEFPLRTLKREIDSWRKKRTRSGHLMVSSIKYQHSNNSLIIFLTPLLIVHA